MNFKKNKKSFIAIAALFLTIGTYNAVVINAESSLDAQDNRFVKRFEELNGVVTPARKLATVWKKLTPVELAAKKKLPTAVTETAVAKSPAVKTQEASIKDALELNLVEVINPKLWQQGLSKKDYNGNLAANDGTIENLTVSLPNKEDISISFIELQGNVFSYDYAGETYSAMMYQVDQKSYMVTLTNGPLEGTRLRFAGEPTAEQAHVEEVLAQNHGVEVGTFGEPVNAQAEAAQFDETAQAQTAEIVQVSI